MEENRQKITCPCCGEQTFFQPTKLDPVLKQHYLSCILTGVPYTKDYSLYDGAVTITMTQMKPKFTDSIVRIGTIAKLLQDTQKRTRIQDIIQRVFRLSCIVKIRVQLQDNHMEFNIQDTVNYILQNITQDTSIQQLNSYYQKLSDPKVVSSIPNAIIDTVIATHSNVLNLLTSCGFDQNFYSGIPKSF